MQQLINKALLSASLLILMAACSSTPSPTETSSSGSSRYSIGQDRAPIDTIDIADIPEVVVEPLVRTMAGNRSPYTVLGMTYRVLPTEEGYNERGVASWYGEKFHGHKTSNGEVFDMYRASAAHKSLPIPSFLQVTNLANNRSIIVRVNDRGPFHGDRIVDLSYAAALKLGFADTGTARVQLEALVPSGAQLDSIASRQSSTTQEIISVANVGSVVVADVAMKYLQVGAFADLNTAREVSERLKELTQRPVMINTVNSQSNGVLHRVRIGPVNDPIEIRQITAGVVAANLGSPYTVTE